jgi:HEAT repeat protein
MSASSLAKPRAQAAELLGFLRAYRAEPALISALRDESEDVRLQAAMALGWCGGRAAVSPLIEALGDPSWTVRQAAHVALTNLTGMEFAFDALADRRQRNEASRLGAAGGRRFLPIARPTRS